MEKKSIINSWDRAIKKSFDDHKEANEKLTPSKAEIRYVADFARNIDKTAQLMHNASEMAHQGIIDFETAQKIMDIQKKNIEKDVKYLLTYLQED